jgi:hypothetical protein
MTFVAWSKAASAAAKSIQAGQRRLVLNGSAVNGGSFGQGR